jgi:hypothetical protein
MLTMVQVHMTTTRQQRRAIQAHREARHGDKLRAPRGG